MSDEITVEDLDERKVSRDEIEKVVRKQFDGLSEAFPAMDMKQVPITEKRRRIDINPQPVEADCRHYLHLLPFLNRDKEQLYRLIVSPFDEELTYMLTKHRDVVTEYGIHSAPCDRWELLYRTSIMYEPLEIEIMVCQLIFSDKMGEFGFFAPMVVELLTDTELNVLLNTYLEEEYRRSMLENSILRDKIRYQEMFIKDFVRKTSEIDLKNTAYHLHMLSKMKEDDQIEYMQDGMGILEKFKGWLSNNPMTQFILGAAFLGLIAFAILSMSGGG